MAWSMSEATAGWAKSRGRTAAQPNCERHARQGDQCDQWQHVVCTCCTMHDAIAFERGRVVHATRGARSVLCRSAFQRQARGVAVSSRASRAGVHVTFNIIRMDNRSSLGRPARDAGLLVSIQRAGPVRALNRPPRHGPRAGRSAVRGDAPPAPRPRSAKERPTRTWGPIRERDFR
jgi:hypothetical protein